MKKREENKTMEKIKSIFAVGAKLTPKEVSERCGIAKRNALHYVNILHKQRFIHVCEWMPYSVAKYAIGNKPDAVKMTAKQRDVVRVMKSRRKKRLMENFYTYQTKSIVSLSLGV